MSRDIDQIRRAWQSATPGPAVNPAAASFHRDLGVALDEIETYIEEVKDLKEQVSALESREVCNAAHDIESNVDCGFCEADRLRAIIQALYEKSRKHHPALQELCAEAHESMTGAAHD